MMDVETPAVWNPEFEVDEEDDTKKNRIDEEDDTKKKRMYTIWKKTNKDQSKNNGWINRRNRSLIKKDGGQIFE